MISQEREKMMLKKFADARARIWGDDANACLICFEENKWFAKCEHTLERRRLNDANYEEVLNDMFYDYCVENASWMGVS